MHALHTFLQRINTFATIYFTLMPSRRQGYAGLSQGERLRYFLFLYGDFQ